MISDFEARLASVLGAQLPAPFTGTVAVSGNNDSTHGSQPRIYLGVYQSEARPLGFGHNRTIAVPGVAGRMRVMALTIRVNINVLAAQSADRTQQLRGIEQLQYLLDQEGFQTGAALLDNSNQGFLIERMSLKQAVIEVTGAPISERPVGLTLEAEGIFWPVGVAGETGVIIDEIRVRGLLLDIEPGSALPVFSAGDAAFDIELHISSSALRLGGDGSPLDFSQVALDLQQDDGSAGAGILSGGSAGAGTARLITINNGVASFSYTPPAQPARDVLLVGFDDGSNGLGQPVREFILETR